MPAVSYPLDTTGLAPANLIVDEVHTLTELNAETYRLIIPEFAPFYLDNFVLKHVDTQNNETILTPDVDFILVLPYIAASRSIGKMLYGGISISNNFVNGLVKLQYQTIGGPWTADASQVLVTLANVVYNPRMTSWDQVTNIQELFPPINHDDSLDYVYGHESLIDALNSLAATVALTPSQTPTYVTHMTRSDNPHGVTKTQVGLGNVQDLPIATPDEIAGKISVQKYVTLDQVLQLLQTVQNP